MAEPTGEKDGGPGTPEPLPPLGPPPPPVLPPSASQVEAPEPDLVSPPQAILDSADEAAALRTTKPARPADPWAHRRGEPRVFALLWTIYLFVITTTVFFSALAGPGISPEVMRPAAQLVLLLTAAGIALLWPMVRLSQAPDPHPLGGAAQDLLVVMIPAQALIWPQVLWWLARWPLSTVMALAGAMAAWGLLIAGLLALRQTIRRRRERPYRRPLGNLVWMLGFVALATAGLLVSLLSGSSVGTDPTSDVKPDSVDLGLMLSPLGAILELTRDTAWTGRSTPLGPSHWLAIALVAAASAVVWALAALRSRRATMGLRFQT